MRVDCINECIMEKIKITEDNCTRPFYEHLFLWRNDTHYLPSKDFRLCEDNWSILGETG